MFDRAREGAKTALAFALAGFLGVHMVVRTCTRAGCWRSFVGRWLVEQGGAAAALVRTVEGVATVLAALAVGGYVLSRVRARF